MSQSGNTSKKRKEAPQPSLEAFFPSKSIKKLKIEQKDDQIVSKAKEQTSNLEEEKVSSSKDTKKEIDNCLDIKQSIKLDLEKLKTIEEFDKKFEEIADIILNQTVMVINREHRYRIAEIEFYFNDHEIHPDTFCHGDQYQKELGNWYFHRLNGKAYKSGTYKGLDISFGNGGKIPGGILIRAIQSLASKGDGDFIEGPCNSVHKIFELCSPKDKKIVEVEPFVSLEGFKLDAFDKSSIFYLSSIHDKENESVKQNMQRMDLVRCPRVFDLSNEEQKIQQFHCIEYDKGQNSTEQHLRQNQNKEIDY